MKILKLLPLFFIFLGAQFIEAKSNENNLSIKLVKIKPSKTKKNAQFKNQKKTERKPAANQKQTTPAKP